MRETTNVSNNGRFSLDLSHHSVVQKGDVGQSYIYALQLQDHAKSTYVFRRSKSGGKFTKILDLHGDAAGHTQTWSYAGPNNWFIGTNPNKGPWATQIARVNIKSNGGPHHTYYDFPCLAYLDRAGNVPYTGSFVRAEAAVSPDHTKFLLVTVDNNGKGYFTIYNLAAINEALDSVQHNDKTNRYFDIGNISEADIVDKFTITNLFSGNVKDTRYILHSLQGFDVDNSNNVFISSQKAPKIDEKTGKFPKGNTYHKEILVIPANARYDQNQWTNVNLSASGVIDQPGTGRHTEVEGIQAIDANNAYLTVAYHIKKYNHRTRRYNSYADYSTIYRLSWY